MVWVNNTCGTAYTAWLPMPKYFKFIGNVYNNIHRNLKTS